MTVILPRSGTTARRQARASRADRRPGRARGGRAFALVAALVAAVMAGGLPALAAERPTAVPAGVSFTLSPIAQGVVAPGDALTVSLTVENRSAARLSMGRFDLAIATSAITDRAALTAWLAGDTAGVQTADVATATAEPVASGESTTTAVQVDADDVALTSRAPGVYPLLSRYLLGDDIAVSTSVMVIPDAGVDSTPLSIIVPITAPAIANGLLDAEQLAELTAPGGSLADQLDAVTGTTAILAVDPAIPAAIRVLGDSAPPNATTWLQRLLELPNSRFALQFGDADVAVQLQAGAARPLQPGSFAAYLDPADFEEPVDATPSPSPEPTEEPDEVVLPTTSELLDIGGGVPAIYWPARGAADAEIADALAAAEVDDQAGTTVVASTQVDEASETTSIGGSGTVGEAAVIVYDAQISDLLTEAAATEEATLRGAPLAAAIAMIELAGTALDGAPLLAAIGRDPDRSELLSPRSVLAAATSAPSVQPISLESLLRRPASEIALRDLEPDETRVSATTMLLDDEVELDSFATVLDDPGLLAGPERAAILQLLGTAWELLPQQWDQVVATHREQTAATLDMVGILPPTRINLFGADADLGYWVRNDLPYPVTVILFAAPDDPRLDVQGETEVVAGPSSNTRAEVPVRARVGNGDVTIALQLRSRTGVEIGDTQFAEVSVRAEWEGIGIGILVGFVGLLIVVGFIRTVRRRRAAARETQADDAPATDAPVTASTATASTADAPATAPEREAGP